MTRVTNRGLQPPWPKGTLCRAEPNGDRLFIVLDDPGDILVRVLDPARGLKLTMLRTWLVPLIT